MKTALRQYIEQLEKSLGGKGKPAIMQDKTTQAHIKLAKAFLAIEKQQLIEAYVAAQKEYIVLRDCYPPQFVVRAAENYYKETFNK